MKLYLDKYIWRYKLKLTQCVQIKNTSRKKLGADKRVSKKEMDIQNEERKLNKNWCKKNSKKKSKILLSKGKSSLGWQQVSHRLVRSPRVSHRPIPLPNASSTGRSLRLRSISIMTDIFFVKTWLEAAGKCQNLSQLVLVSPQVGAAKGLHPISGPKIWPWTIWSVLPKPVVQGLVAFSHFIPSEADRDVHWKWRLGASCLKLLSRSFVSGVVPPHLRLDIPSDIGELAPMTPPELRGARRYGDRDVSPGTPPGLRRNRHQGPAFFAGTPPRLPPPGAFPLAPTPPRGGWWPESPPNTPESA